jgi:hypothetical protein
VFAEYDDFGFPPPAIFFAAVKPEPVFDSQAILRQIDRSWRPTTRTSA